MGEPRSWEIILTPEAQTFLTSLPPSKAARMWNAIGQLEQGGPDLGAPTVKLIKGSRVRNMKELRAAGSLRLLFRFDDHRRAVMLVGGDKRGEWNKWYEGAIRSAEKALTRYERNSGEVTGWRDTGPV